MLGYEDVSINLKILRNIPIVAKEKRRMLFIERKAVSTFILTLLLSSMLTFAFNIQPVRTETRTTVIPTPIFQWVWTDKQFYLIGENVTIFRHNSANSTLEIGGWWVERWNGSDWNTVYSHIRLMIIIPIEPCEVVTSIWDQRGSEENPDLGPFYQVSPGTYRVVWQPGDLDTEEPYATFIYAFTILGVITMPAPPSQPQPNYTWVDTNEAFLYLTIDGVNYLTGLVFGVYMPETIELGKKHSIYIYTTRIFEPEIITVPLTSPFSAKVCVGLGIEVPPGLKYLHIGLGFNLLGWGGWDLKMWHMPLWIGCDLSLSVSYPNITYSNLLEIPLNEWDGPYEAQFTLIGGHILLEAITVEVENVSYGLNILTNSILSNLVFSQPQKSASFSISGDSSTTGFSNVTIPKILLAGPWQVKIDNSSIPFIETQNSTHSFLYFTYNHSTKTVDIIGTYAIPELPSALILPLLMVLSAIAVVFAKKRRPKKTQT